MVDENNLNSLAEQAAWVDAIVQLENGWHPTGGAVDPASNQGILNWQAQQLASRTKYLLKMLGGIGDTVNTVPSLNTIKATGFYGVGNNATGHPQSGQAARVLHIETAFGAAQIALLSAGILKFRVRDATNWAAWNTVFNSGNQGSGSNIDADRLDGKHYEEIINDAKAAIISSAPGTLDTLNELAAALGDDPNFAATVLNNLATKANKSGDTFTGDVIVRGDIGWGDGVPQHFITDNDGAGNANIRFGHRRNVATSTNDSTIPNGSGVHVEAFVDNENPRFIVRLLKPVGGPGPIGTDLAEVSNFTFADGYFRYNGHDVWTDDAASKLLSEVGYQKLPSGLIIQWGNGVVTVADGNGEATAYPIAFPNDVFLVIATDFSNSDSVGTIQGVSIRDYTTSNAQFTAVAWDTTGNWSTSGFRWIALGH